MFRHRLAEFFRRRSGSSRALAELPWQLNAIGQWSELSQLLCRGEFLKRAWDRSELEVNRLWSSIEADSPHRIEQVYIPVLQDPAANKTQAEIVLRLLLARRRMGAAQSLFSWLEEDCRTEANPVRRIAIIHLLGELCLQREDWAGALSAFKTKAEIARATGDRAAEAAGVGNQALALQRLGRRGEALELFRIEERLCREAGDFFGATTALANQGTLLVDADTDLAMTCFREQEKACRLAGDFSGLQSSLGNQGALLLQRNQGARSLPLLKEQNRICRQLGDLAALQLCLGNLALALERTLDYDAAWETLRESTK